MEIAKGVEAKYEAGKIIVEVKVADQVNPLLEKLKGDIESGAVDLVKGTDIDKAVVLPVIALIQEYINK